MAMGAAGVGIAVAVGTEPGLGLDVAERVVFHFERRRRAAPAAARARLPPDLDDPVQGIVALAGIDQLLDPAIEIRPPRQIAERVVGVDCSSRRQNGWLPVSLFRATSR